MSNEVLCQLAHSAELQASGQAVRAHSYVLSFNIDLKIVVFLLQLSILAWFALLVVQCWCCQCLVPKTWSVFVFCSPATVPDSLKVCGSSNQPECGRSCYLISLMIESWFSALIKCLSVCLIWCPSSSGPWGSVPGDAHSAAGASDWRQRGGRHLLPEGVRTQTDRGVPAWNQRYAVVTTINAVKINGIFKRLELFK